MCMYGCMRVPVHDYLGAFVRSCACVHSCESVVIQWVTLVHLVNSTKNTLKALHFYKIIS